MVRVSVVLLPCECEFGGEFILCEELVVVVCRCVVGSICCRVLWLPVGVLVHLLGCVVKAYLVCVIVVCEGGVVDGWWYCKERI